MRNQIEAAKTFVQANCPELAAILVREEAAKVHSIFADMSQRLIRWGSLSEKQITFARKLYKEHLERQANGGKTSREAQWAKEKELAQDCPAGRTQVTGTVLSVKPHESRFGTTMKMTVKDDKGFVVWMTIPASIETVIDASSGYCRNLQKGDRIEVTVNVTVSDNDSKFGFGKRPSNAKCLSGADKDGLVWNFRDGRYESMTPKQEEPKDDGKAVYIEDYRDEPTMAALASSGGLM